MTNFSEIERLARAIEIDGLAAVPHDLIRTIASEAVQRGASPVLANVLIDPSQPNVARNRAFGRITAAFRAVDRPLTLVA